MATPGKTVHELATLIGGTLASDRGSKDLIVDVTHDSRLAGPEMLFVAVKGAVVDGHEFIPQALERGATAVCVSHPSQSGVAEIVVPDTRRVLGPLAAAVHGNPSSAMDVVGVTGTNGKTTVTHYIESITASAGLVAGLIGTIHTRIGGESVPSVRTTPEASDLQRLFAVMRDKGVRLVAVEVSSHALELRRVEATRFSVAAFTNLSQDHLDFHGDMDRYLAAKRRLFEEHEVGVAVVNIDDPSGERIAGGLHDRLLTVGATGQVRSVDVERITGGTAFTLSTPWGSARVATPVMGAFNVANATLAAACCLAVGVELDRVASGLETLAGVPGRFETVSGHDPIRVIVDYAHTPEGISKAIGTVRGEGTGRIIVVAGAGGDRDTEKRPLMGAALSAADLAVITSDNPRSEDPGTIAEAVAGGVDPATESIVDLDRRGAIEHAVREAGDGDTVLVLGRGHEPMQEIGGLKQPFDDRQVARQALASRRGSPDFWTDSGSMEE